MKFTQEQKRNLAHALMHLEDNDIHEPDGHRGWYIGVRRHFESRHVKAIGMIREWLDPAATFPVK
jgi:hypothetical protein